MKKLLLGVIAGLLVILTGITVVKGFKIGSIEVLGVQAIKQKNDELDEKVKEATKLASTDYQRKIDDLNNEIKKLQTEKNNYQEMVSVSTDSEVEAANQSYENMIEFLLVRIENHAKSEGVIIDLTVSRSSSGAENVYNLNFTALGSYVGIEEFITDIEDDAKLGYKIEEFKMTASSQNGSTVQATFVCRDISIEGLSSSGVDTSTTNTNTVNENNVVENSNQTNNNAVNANQTNTENSAVTNNTAQ